MLGIATATGCPSCLDKAHRGRLRMSGNQRFGFVSPSTASTLHEMRMRSHVNRKINDFKLDCVSTGLTRRKNVVEYGNDFVSWEVSEFMIHLVNARAWNVVAWLKYVSQSVALLTKRDLEQVGVFSQLLWWLRAPSAVPPRPPWRQP